MQRRQNLSEQQHCSDFWQRHPAICSCFRATCNKYCWLKWELEGVEGNTGCMLGSSGRKMSPWRMAQCHEVASQMHFKIMLDDGCIYSFVASPAPKSSLAGLGCSPSPPPAEVPAVWTHTSLKITSPEEFCLVATLHFCLYDKKPDYEWIIFIGCNGYLLISAAIFPETNGKFSWHSWAKWITATPEGADCISPFSLSAYFFSCPDSFPHLLVSFSTHKHNSLPL